MAKTIESAFTRDYPDADCYVDAANGVRPQTGKSSLCSCASGHCAKREAEGDPVERDQSKHVDEHSVLRYSADGSEVFPGPTGVRR